MEMVLIVIVIITWALQGIWFCREIIYLMIPKVSLSLYILCFLHINGFHTRKKKKSKKTEAKNMDSNKKMGKFL